MGNRREFPFALIDKLKINKIQMPGGQVSDKTYGS